jgi:adenylate cyclase
VQRDEFAFRHPLVQEAAYTSLLTNRRREMHRRAAAALSVHFKARGNETAALIAHHWEEAGEVAQAAAAYVNAALWIGTRDPRQALEAWRSVRRLLETVSPGPPVDYMLMMACGQIVNYAWREGINAAEVEPVYEQAITLARKLNDMRAVALITMAFGRVLAATGSAEQYVAKVEEAQHLLAGTDLPSVSAVLAAVHSHALSTAQQFERALIANEKAFAVVHNIDAQDRQTLGFNPEHWLAAQRARALMRLDRMEEARPLLDDLLREKNGPVDTLHRALAHAVHVEDAIRRGDGQTAQRLVDALSTALKGNETPYLRVLEARYRGEALLATGDALGATAELEKALSYSESNRAGLEMRSTIQAGLVEARRLLDAARLGEDSEARL